MAAMDAHEDSESLTIEVQGKSRKLKGRGFRQDADADDTWRHDDAHGNFESFDELHSGVQKCKFIEIYLIFIENLY